MSTEKEAEKLWCAMAGTRATGSGCISSLCAMWRWDQTRPVKRGWAFAKNEGATTEVDSGGPSTDTVIWYGENGSVTGDAIPNDWTFIPSEHGDPAGWIEPQKSADARRHGFCGLAGKLIDNQEKKWNS